MSEERVFDADAFYRTFAFCLPGTQEYDVHCQNLLALSPADRDRFIFEFLNDPYRLWFLETLVNHLLEWYADQLDASLSAGVRYVQEVLGRVSASIDGGPLQPLPHDLRAEILKHVPAEDRSRLSFVNHSSRAMVAAYEAGHLRSDLVQECEPVLAFFRAFALRIQATARPLYALDLNAKLPIAKLTFELIDALSAAARLLIFEPPQQPNEEHWRRDEECYRRPHQFQEWTHVRLRTQ